jgi:hypothetical protein
MQVPKIRSSDFRITKDILENGLAIMSELQPIALLSEADCISSTARIWRTSHQRQQCHCHEARHAEFSENKTDPSRIPVRLRRLFEKRDPVNSTATSRL